MSMGHCRMSWELRVQRRYLSISLAMGHAMLVSISSQRMQLELLKDSKCVYAFGKSLYRAKGHALAVYFQG